MPVWKPGATGIILQPDLMANSDSDDDEVPELISDEEFMKFHM
jgi:hypothetical protein